jgi:adenine-specific DNA methylase
MTPNSIKHGFLIHDYFFAATLEKVRPGGLVMFITSRGTMDKADIGLRKYVGDRADLLGAVRLPQQRF